MSRAEAVQRAVELAGSCRYPIPAISEKSSRGELIAFLESVDPNGIYSDDDLVSEHMDPMSLDDAWDQVISLMED